MTFYLIYINKEFIFTNNAGGVLYNIPRSLMSNTTSALVQNRVISAQIKNKYIDLFLLRNRRHIQFSENNRWYVLEGKNPFKLRYTIQIDNLNYLLVPHSGGFGSYISFFCNNMQCGYAKFYTNIGKDNIFAKIVINSDVNILHPCSFITSLFVYYKHNYFEQFVGYTGLNYLNFNPNWKSN